MGCTQPELFLVLVSIVVVDLPGISTYESKTQPARNRGHAMKATRMVLVLALVAGLGCSGNEQRDELDVQVLDSSSREPETAQPETHSGEELREMTDEDRPGPADMVMDVPEAPFVEFDWLVEPPDPQQRICEEASDPDGAPDKVFIHCPVEGEAFVSDVPDPKESLVVWTYNLERGQRLDGQIETFLDGTGGPAPDVLLLSELDRGCSRSGYRHVTRELAQAMGMNYLFAVEFVELQGAPGEHVARCEHGNAILSRYPLGNVEVIRHATQTVWYKSTSEPRLGGRVALAADVRVGHRVLRVVTVHFESKTEDARSAQAKEIALAMETSPGLVVVGGDMNCGFLAVDLMNSTEFDSTLSQFTTRGWFDAHSNLSISERVTSPSHNFILDILVSNEDRFSNPGVGDKAIWEELSDHLPVWATVDLW